MAVRLTPEPDPAPARRPREDLETVEVDLILEGIHRHYGYDFRGYSKPSVRRRLWRRANAEGMPSISALQAAVLHDPDVMDRLLRDLSINVTSMFRDPTFFAALRAHVVPLLRTYPFIRVWNAGCSTGEETYSLAILLHEEGLGDRVRLYATDVNDHVIDRARRGVFPLSKMREYTRNYIAAGGTAAFSDYYESDGTGASFHPWLADRVVFAQHNLVSDGSFNEFNLIVCRNVMIYFDRELQDAVHSLFFNSLVRFGILALGHKETINFTRHAEHYETLDVTEKLYRRVE